MRKFKDTVMTDIAKHSIPIYDFPIDPDHDDEETIEENNELRVLWVDTGHVAIQRDWQRRGSHPGRPQAEVSQVPLGNSPSRQSYPLRFCKAALLPLELASTGSQGDYPGRAV